jgi:hypothetical protein
MTSARKAWLLLGAVLLVAGLVLGTRQLGIADPHSGTQTGDCGTVFQPNCNVTRNFGSRVLVTAFLTTAGLAVLGVLFARWFTARNGGGWSTGELAFAIVPAVILVGLLSLAGYWIYVIGKYEGG